MPRLIVGCPLGPPHTDTSTLAATVSTLLSNNVECAPTTFENPANHASAVGPSHWAAAASRAAPTGVLLNCTTPSESVSGPVAETWAGTAAAGPSTTQPCPSC